MIKKDYCSSATGSSGSKRSIGKAAAGLTGGVRAIVCGAIGARK
ncbi:hypothetical protein [Neobacillus cucumis]|nr:hypothetical protein [Neobacillus cucumis]